MSEEGGLKLISDLKDEFDERKGMSRDHWIAEYCAPMSRGEVWIQNLTKTFGKTLVESRASVQRVAAFLRTQRARPEVLKCMKNGIPLQGAGEEIVGCCVFSAAS